MANEVKGREAKSSVDYQPWGTYVLVKGLGEAKECELRDKGGVLFKKFLIAGYGCDTKHCKIDMPIDIALTMNELNGFRVKVDENNKSFDDRLKFINKKYADIEANRARLSREEKLKLVPAPYIKKAVDGKTKLVPLPSAFAIFELVEYFIIDELQIRGCNDTKWNKDKVSKITKVDAKGK